MMLFVIGGSGSGKSAYAENALASLSGERGCRNYYLAAMQILDDEGRRKAQRHRELRRGRGFLTIEQPVSVHRALEKMAAGEKSALLECIANLAANEMFSGGAPKTGNQAALEIIRGVGELKRQLAHLVVVSSNVFEDGTIYDEAVMEYIRAMGRINRALADMADEVVEVVAGIPVMVKRPGAV